MYPTVIFINQRSSAMASIAFSFNPDAEPSSGYRPLPEGDYVLEMVESDYLPTIDGLGMILKTKCQVVGGDFDLRPYYINYVLEHADEARQKIGQRDFAGLRRATGVLELSDSEEIHFKTFSVKIGVKARKETGELENVIREYILPQQAA
jgi:hypothetical protein